MAVNPSGHPRRRLGPRFASVAVLLVFAVSGAALSGLERASASTKPAIVGTWRPASVSDYDGALTAPPLLVAPVVRFTAKGRVSGSDGCNSLSGSYRLGRDGAVKFQVSSTKRLCFVPNPPSPLYKAVRVSVDKGRLIFYASGGRELARYVRSKATTPK